jgi:uncharacterized protein (TIGR03083 family)
MSMIEPPSEMIDELRYALAQADAEETDPALRDRVVLAATARRPAGRPVLVADHISGLAALRRTAARLDDLLSDLAAHEWECPALRGLTVQGLVGHLLGVEQGFAGTVRGHVDGAEDDHIAATDATAAAQRDQSPERTLHEWRAAVAHTVEVVSNEHDADRSIRFQRITLPLDLYLVVRAFEMWIHDEDIRRATGRELAGPDARTLARMTGLAARLLPTGASRAGHDRDATVRLVLTGRSGGTWDVPLNGGDVRAPAPGAEWQARVVVDAAQFCRIVANRADLAGSSAVTSGDDEAALALCAAAATLALD